MGNEDLFVNLHESGRLVDSVLSARNMQELTLILILSHFSIVINDMRLGMLST